MVEVQGEIVIDRRPEDVFDGPIGVGTTFRAK
jgi:hypothetical protein